MRKRRPPYKRWAFGTMAVVLASGISITTCVKSLGSTRTEGMTVFGIPLAGKAAIEIPAAQIEPPAQETEVLTYEIPNGETEQSESLVYSRDWDADESYLLAKIAMAEAENQDIEGKALVICVVLNRVWSNGFPDNIHDVIYQPKQFSPVSNGRFDMVEPNEECWEALNMVMVDGWDESQGALYFESKSESTWHRDNLKFLFQHGAHLFYTDKEE